MIKNITVNHFKSLESCSIDFEDVTVFVGPNSAGKSNVVDAIRFVTDALKNGLDRAVSDRHGINSIKQWSPTRPYQVSISLNVEEGSDSGRYSFVLASSKDQYKIKREEADWKYTDSFFVDVHDADDEAGFEEMEVSYSFIRDEEGGLEFQADAPFSLEHVEVVEDDDELFLISREASEFRGLRRLLTSCETYSIFPNTLRAPQEPTNEVLLSAHGQNLCSVFKRMRKKKSGADAVANIISAMKQIMPNLEQINIKSVGGFLVPQFQVIEDNGQGHVFNVSQISDGTLRALGILTALYQDPKPSVIAIEEPELTVNPGVLPVLVDAIREASASSQIIITTHSPDLLDHFDPKEVRAVEHSEGRTLVSPIRKAQVTAVRQKLFTLGEILSSEGIRG